MKKKIGVISAFNPKEDKKAHSGLLYRMNMAIEDAGFETVWIKNSESKLYRLLARFCTFLSLVLPKKIHLNRTYLGTYLLYRTLDKTKIGYVDYLMVIHYYHIPLWLKTNIPIIYRSDATFNLANNYYFNNLWKWNVKQGEGIEKKALANCCYHISASNWRNESLINHYDIPEEKCFVLENGPCIEAKNRPYSYSGDEILRMVFSGVDWERKGGQIAVDVCNSLNVRGVKCKLYIVGIKEIPESCLNNSNIEFVGFLNKNKEDEYNLYVNIIRNSHLMILPTKAEFAGVVFSEASLLGIPILTYDTGGISNYVINGLNGYRLPLNSGSEGFVDEVLKIISSNRFTVLSEGALTHSRNKLNWSNWVNWYKAVLK